MRLFYSLTILFLFKGVISFAQSGTAPSQGKKTPVKENIYDIKKNFLYHVLHNPTDRDERNENDKQNQKAKEKDENDNDLARFNRWFNFAEPRCYPTGDMPSPGIVVTETKKAELAGRRQTTRKTSTSTAWQSIGPLQVPVNNNGIGRINCIVINPLDTNTLYVGSACGGVHISHDGGLTWTSNTDNFPSLSIADIAVDPIHTDTIYAATGDGYGYVDDGYNTFWGGLYSAGIMKSTDGGNTWDTTGFSFIQSNREIVQKLLINPIHPDTLLAATTNGIYKTINGGATWTHVYSLDHVYSMAFRPGSPDTVYAVNNTSLIVSHNGGNTWITLYPGINPTADRASIAVSPDAPNDVWLLDANENLHWSHDGGVLFYTTPVSPSDVASFYGYYDRVLAVSPVDSNYVLACGEFMGLTVDGGLSWHLIDPMYTVHVDNHAIAINQLHPATMYTGNDGGICVTRDGGITWTNIANGMEISQIYRISSSQQNPNTLICGLQDNGSITYNGTDWIWVTGGDGEACAINPLSDNYQVSSSEFGNFNLSYDGGITFNYITINDTGSWTTPVAYDPNNVNNIYFGFQHIWASYDAGLTFTQISGELFPEGGASYLAIAPSNSNVIYASDESAIWRTMDGGTSWSNVTGTLPTSSVAITRIAVDPRDPMRVFVSTSGYVAGKKVFLSIVGGSNWTNISQDLPNLPADCIAIDTSTSGALFVGTDIGVYYTDSSQTGWTLYQTGLPNVIVDDLNINYASYKVIAATYGRGAWQCDLKNQPAALSAPSVVTNAATGISLFPNPTNSSWELQFPKQSPANFSVKVSDVSGRIVFTQKNSYHIDASALANGIYNLEVTAGEIHYNIKAIKE